MRNLDRLRNLPPQEKYTNDTCSGVKLSEVPFLGAISIGSQTHFKID